MHRADRIGRATLRTVRRLTCPEPGSPVWQVTVRSILVDPETYKIGHSTCGSDVRPRASLAELVRAPVDDGTEIW